MSKKAKEPEVSRDPIEGTWRGVPVWQCPFCDRDSDNKATIEAHIEGDHPVYVPHPLAPATPAVAEEGQANGSTATDQDGVHGTVSDSGDNGH
jgi:hypothetical protein